VLIVQPISWLGYIKALDGGVRGLRSRAGIISFGAGLGGKSAQTCPG